MKHTLKTKRQMSIKRKEYLKKNKNKHNWSLYRKLESEPERRFRYLIKHFKDLKIFQNFIPDESKRLFEIDFAILNKKIGFEINGNQHYNNKGELKKYYLDRHKYLESLGWKIVEIHYSICFNKDRLRKIIEESFDGNFKFSESFNNKIFRGKLIRERRRILKSINDKRKSYNFQISSLNKQLKDLQKIEKFLKLNDLAFGSLTKISKHLNMSHTHIRRILMSL